MKKLAMLVLLLPALAPAIYDMKWFDLNHWSCPFHDYGPWGIDITVNRAGGSWPQPLKNFYIFGAGPWVGSIVGNDTFVTVGYNPNSGGTEFGPTLCRYWRQGTADSADRVYKYPEDWPPPQSRFPMAPQQPRSESDMWCCFGDSDPARHVAQWSASDVALAGDYAYLACSNAGLLIIDVSNPQSPYEVGHYNTPGPAYGVAVVGSYAYVADQDSGLRIIDVSNPQSPFEAGYCDTPGWALGVAVAGSYAYVADFGLGLRIIDVSNPQSPFEAGHCNTPGVACDVAVVGSYAYVADAFSGLRIIDVSNPQSPHEVGHCNTPGAAYDVAVAGSYAYVADDTSGLRIIDVSNPQSPCEVGYCDTPGSAFGVTVVSTMAYVADGASGLRIIDASNPQSPYEAGYCDTPGSAFRLAVAGSHAYVADEASGLRVINISNPQSPHEVGHCDGAPGLPLGIDICLTAYGFSDSIARDLFILKYELANRSGSPLSRIYFGIALDGDVGSGTDDMTGLIRNKLFQVGSDTFRVKDVGYIYDDNNREDSGQYWQSGTPGAVAVRLLTAPHGLRLTAFKKYTLDIDPVTDPDQYLTLAGYDYRTGIYNPYDSIDVSPADKRALLASGPFDLAPDSTVAFWYAVIGSPYGDSGQGPQGRDTTELALRCWWAEQVFQRVIGVAEEPPASRNVQPFATIVRGVLLLEARGEMREARCELLDITGRKVLDLCPGPNDVSRLSPGVYFVREEPRAASHKRQAVRKVLITK